MESQMSDMRSVEPPPAQEDIHQIWRPAVSSPERGDKAVPRRLEWIAVILFVVNFFMMMFMYSLFYREEAWGLFTVTICIVTGVVLLLSVVFSIFGKTELSKYALGVGIIGLMVSIVSIGVKLMQEISEWSDRVYPF